jgi:predicted nucleic acid-binding protein
VEEGSDAAAELWNTTSPAAASILSHPEACAALAAARRARRLTADGHRRSLTELDRLRSELVIIGIDEALAEHAGGLAADLGLRGYDAVHLASALSLGAGETVLVTGDRSLAAAGIRSGLAVAPAR